MNFMKSDNKKLITVILSSPENNKKFLLLININ